MRGNLVSALHIQATVTRCSTLALLAFASGALLTTSGCEGSAGGFTHAVTESTISSELTATLGDGEPIAETAVDATRLQQCRGGLIGLSIGSGTRGVKGQPRLTTLYLKAPIPIEKGTYPLRYRLGRWETPWGLDGTITPDPSRNIAPFGMEAEGTLDGNVTIERSDVDGNGVRHVAGTLTAKVDGDSMHKVSVTAKFSVDYPATDGCP
jgi:hypothetical protein